MRQRNKTKKENKHENWKVLEIKQEESEQAEDFRRISETKQKEVIPPRGSKGFKEK